MITVAKTPILYEILFGEMFENPFAGATTLAAIFNAMVAQNAILAVSPPRNTYRNPPFESTIPTSPEACVTSPMEKPEERARLVAQAKSARHNTISIGPPTASIHLILSWPEYEIHNTSNRNSPKPMKGAAVIVPKFGENTPIMTTNPAPPIHD